MSAVDISSHTHDHSFLGRDHRRNEYRVRLVIALTASMMVVEIAAGTIYGSMALVADGRHMSTHAGAMLITALLIVASGILPVAVLSWIGRGDRQPRTGRVPIA